MKAIIQKRPIYLFLLSIFFVFHGYTENYDFIPVKDVLLLCLLYLGSSVLLALVFWFLYKNSSKAAFIAFTLMSAYFFFGYIYDNLYSISPNGIFSKYSVILVLLLGVILFFFIYLFRHRGSLYKLTYVLNIFLICLLVVDAVWLITKIVRRNGDAGTKFLSSFSICDTCARPDIYLVIADDYAGDQELQEMMGFDNVQFENQLQKRGFHSPQSVSNYNFTPFSIASMLQMEYLGNIDRKNTSHNDLSICYDLIRENKVVAFLSAYGYKLFNYSIFDIHDQPAMVTESILPEKTKFITAQTLFNRIDKNMLFNMANRLGARQKMRRLMLSHHSNVRAIDSIKNLAGRNLSEPKFVYAHLIMPHFPYYFDKFGKSRGLTQLREGDEQKIDDYVEYLQYTNGVLLNLIDTVLLKSKRPPIIILASDHGFREFNKKVDRKYYFMNHLSIHLPDQNYTSLYDNISNVNLFRVLFNHQFHQQFKLLKDTTIFINP